MEAPTAHVRRRKPEAARRTSTAKLPMTTITAARWEYVTLKIDVDRLIRGPAIDVKDISRHLNHFGDEGWELVSMIDVNAGEGRTCDLVAVFKRATG